MTVILSLGRTLIVYKTKHSGSADIRRKQQKNTGTHRNPKIAVCFLGRGPITKMPDMVEHDWYMCSYTCLRQYTWPSDKAKGSYIVSFDNQTVKFVARPAHVPCLERSLGRGMRGSRNQQGGQEPFHRMRARHIVNQGFGKEFCRKGTSAKRSRPFSEPPALNIQIFCAHMFS